MFLKKLDPTEAIEISVGTALLVDAVLLVVLFVANNARKLDTKPTPTPAPPRAIISEDDRRPSLARFQLLVWTFVVIFAFVTVSLTRMLSGVLLSVTIPANILTLIGINVGSPVVSAGISRQKYHIEEKFEDPKGTANYAPLVSMLEENGEFSATRFQMLAWTFIAVLIFLATVAGTLSNLPKDLTTLNLPDVSSTLVTLSGISQAAYLTGKGVSK